MNIVIIRPGVMIRKCCVVVTVYILCPGYPECICGMIMTLCDFHMLYGATRRSPNSLRML